MGGPSNLYKGITSPRPPILVTTTSNLTVSQDELRTIVQRRNDFEHRVLSPNSAPSDYTAYAAWEATLAALVTKRCTRLRLRASSTLHASQGRILQIYSRGVERHRLCKPLWLQYLAYMRKMRAHKRWRTSMTRLLRLRPADDDLWVMAARRAAEAGDMAGARSLFVRGCRFCVRTGEVWVEYARAEMQALRREVQSRSKEATKKVQVAESAEEDVIDMGDDDEDDMVDEDGVIRRDDEAEVEGERIISEDDENALQKARATDGSIPQAVFDIARKQSFFDVNVAESFFVVFAAFANLEVGARLVQHVLDIMREQFPEAAPTCACYVQQPVLGVSPLTAEFPRALREVLVRLKAVRSTTSDQAGLQEKVEGWVDRMLSLKDLDSNIRQVLEHIRDIGGADGSS
jgi:U3 small nucleolar RNA-associated protein 6